MDGRGGTNRSGQRGNVRSLARASARPCARPGCPAPAQATLSFRYGAREASLGPLLEERDPNTYDLCIAHADRTRPPHGWDLVDDRPTEPVPGPPAAIGDDRTVALLAEALGRARAAEGTDPIVPTHPVGAAAGTTGTPAERPAEAIPGTSAAPAARARAPLALREDGPSYPAGGPTAEPVEPAGAEAPSEGSTWDRGEQAPPAATDGDADDVAVLTDALAEVRAVAPDLPPAVGDGTARSW